MANWMPGALISLLVALPVTVALMIAREEWRSATPLLKRQAWISLATIPPNVAMYLLLAPLWATTYVTAESIAWTSIEVTWSSVIFIVLA